MTEQNSKSSAEQFDRTERSVGHYSRVVANRGLGGKSWWKLLQFHTQLSAQLASSKLDSKQSNWKLFTYSIFISKASFLELVYKELNHLTDILYGYARGLTFMKKQKIIIIFQKEKGNTFTLLIISIVKILQKEQRSTNLLYSPE